MSFFGLNLSPLSESKDAYARKHHWMKLHATSAIIAFLLIWMSPAAHGQQASSDAVFTYPELVDRAYGQDQELVNGLQYFDHHPRSLGNPYLLDGFVRQGWVRIRGVVYNPIWLRYDIYRQQVEVEYLTLGGADNQVVLVGDRVDYFQMGEHYFENLSLQGEKKQFYQVIGAGRMKCYISWTKKLVPVSGDSRFIEEFTNPKRSYLLELDGQIHEFRSKSEFVKLLPESRRKEMKKLVRQNNMQFRIASPAQLNLFLLAAAKILNQDLPE
jgi:hypothetical protein